MLLKLLFSEGYTTGLSAFPGTKPQADLSTVTTAVSAPSGQFSHSVADELCSKIRASRPARTVIVDLKEIEDATTAAFARLVLLRRDLLRHGRDLRLKGLRSRAASIWRVSRLNCVLPMV